MDGGVGVDGERWRGVDGDVGDGAELGGSKTRCGPGWMEVWVKMEGARLGVDGCGRRVG